MSALLLTASAAGGLSFSHLKNNNLNDLCSSIILTSMRCVFVCVCTCQNEKFPPVYTMHFFLLAFHFITKFTDATVRKSSLSSSTHLTRAEKYKQLHLQIIDLAVFSNVYCKKGFFFAEKKKLHDNDNGNRTQWKANILGAIFPVKSIIFSASTLMWLWTRQPTPSLL